MSKVKINKSSTRDLTQLHSPKYASTVSLENQIPPPPSEELKNQEDVTLWFFNQFLPYIIDDVALYDPEKDETESICDGTDTIPSEVFQFLGSRANSLFELRAQRKQPTNNKAPKKLERSKSSVLKRSKSDKKSSVTITSSKRTSRTSSINTIHNVGSISSFIDENQQVRIFFKNGGIYTGHIKNKLMHGSGKYVWADGTIYEGEFAEGFASGLGEMTLPNMDSYKGEFLHGFYHGEGTLNVKGTSVLYRGSWKQGKKHGNGWIMYEENNWYNGEWQADLRHGKGIRYYPTKAKYKGEYSEGSRHGQGIMIWENNDLYVGNWANGEMNGYGEYVWNTIFNTTLAFPIRTCYEGDWVNGKRQGKGAIQFGSDCGARYSGEWIADFKDGAGTIFCGNGKVVEGDPLFKQDRPVMWLNAMIAPDKIVPGSPFDIPVFTTAETVDAGYYIDKILLKLGNYRREALPLVRDFEQLCIRNVIVEYLPKLTKLYKDYSEIALGHVEESVNFKPVMIRLFLWMLYMDIGVPKMGMSLAETDLMLKEHPGVYMDTVHDPYEKIYFWQFLLSLVGVSLHLKQLEEQVDFSLPEGACSIILKTFFKETVFKPFTTSASYVLRYIDLVPLCSVYGLYKSVGEPHTAKKLLKTMCVRKHQRPLMCLFKDDKESYEVPIGRNMVPLLEKVYFIQDSSEVINEKPALQRLIDFRCLGPKNVTKIFCKVCPMIMSDGVISNMEYPIVFIEFYEILLNCIFLYLDLKLKREKKQLVEQMEIARLATVPPIAPSKVRLSKLGKSQSMIKSSRSKISGENLRTSRSGTSRTEKVKKRLSKY